MVKLSNFMVGTVLVALIITLFNVFLSGINQNYASANYDEDSLEAYNKLDEMNTQTEEIKEEVADIKENPSALDVIGGFFTSGYNAMKLTFSSFDTFNSMMNSALTDAHLGVVGVHLKTAVGAIILILIFVGVVISAILKYGI